MNRAANPKNPRKTSRSWETIQRTKLSQDEISQKVVDFHVYSKKGSRPRKNYRRKAVQMKGKPHERREVFVTEEEFEQDPDGFGD